MTTRIAATPARPVARAPVRVATAVSWTVVSVVLVADLAVPSGWRGFAWVVLVAGLLLGLPHGAVDHLVAGWWLGRRAPHVVGLVAAYAVVAGAAYGLFTTFPAAGLAVFVLLSGWHFGTGDLGFDDLRTGSSRRHRLLRATAHAAVVLALPALVHPGAVEPIVASITTTAPTVPESARTAAIAVVLVLVTLAVVGEWSQRRGLWATELVLLTLLVLTTDPLVAFGAYFGGWHSVRHLARVLVDNPANGPALRRGSLREPLLGFSRAAVLPTAVSLGLLAALWVSGDGWRDFAGDYMALLAGLTVPHLLVVAWSDRRRAAPGPVSR
ncbi:MAG: Brp/Blh family beta-carotene 15,15'-dioxygenase [Nocardioidaceae bacterium]|nr:Brp/Blh family beta-carotene 15,15'-dioxygenase [Nocardioidaceae bacterium]